MFKEGDKVKVVANKFNYMPGYVGRRGRVVGGASITPNSCRVKLVNDKEYWFDNDELELDK